jgi:hypothetical protein
VNRPVGGMWKKLNASPRRLSWQARARTPRPSRRAGRPGGRALPATRPARSRSAGRAAASSAPASRRPRVHRQGASLELRSAR